MLRLSNKWRRRRWLPISSSTRCSSLVTSHQRPQDDAEATAATALHRERSVGSHRLLPSSSCSLFRCSSPESRSAFASSDFRRIALYLCPQGSLVCFVPVIPPTELHTTALYSVGQSTSLIDTHKLYSNHLAARYAS